MTTKKNTNHSKKGRNFDYKKKNRLSYEGKSARKELKRISKYSRELDVKLRNHDDLPEWVQKKIILASDYMGSVYHYMDFKIEEHKGHNTKHKGHNTKHKGHNTKHKGHNTKHKGHNTKHKGHNTKKRGSQTKKNLK